MGASRPPGDPWPLAEWNVDTGLPLEGVRVLDLSRVLAGPLCAMVVGDLGADVIKVEAPGGDPVRVLAPPRFGDDATYYLAVNRHRRNVVADLTDPHDRERVRALVERADAVVENYLPSQRHSLGIDDLVAANPDAVWVSITPATVPGPLSDEPSFDLLAQARSGLMSVTGTADGPPTKVGAPIADVVAGLYGTVGLLAGLLARASDRPGRRFEAPLLESAMTALVNQAQGYLVNGVTPRRLGNDHPSIAPYGPVRVSDGDLILAVGTDAQFARLVAAIDDEDLTSRVDLLANDARVSRREELTQILERVMSSRTRGEWSRQLAAAGVPHAPVLDVAGALAQDQVTSEGLVVETDAPAGVLRVLASPLVVDGERLPVRSGPRRFGQDSAELGF